VLFCLASRGALHEGEFLLLVFLLHLLALLLRKTPLAGLFRLLVVVALMVQVLDLITASQFQMRLTLHKVMEFAGEPGEVSSSCATFRCDRSRPCWRPQALSPWPPSGTS